MVPLTTRATSRPRVLVFAYACEPGRGSEPGAGWGLVRTVADFADCVVLVGPEHIPGIRSWESGNTTRAISVVEVPEPKLGSYAKWHRVTRFVVYLAWLKKAYRAGRELHAKRPFDAVYHATYSTYWLPAPAIRFGLPSVWGPVGGASRTPLRLWPLLGWKGLLDELLDLISVRLAAWWPATRRTWREVTARIVQNEETLARLPKSLRDRIHVLNHVMFIEVPQVAPRQRRAHVLYVSPLESRKGPRLAIRALAHTPEDVRLLMAGDGPERGALKRLARKLSVSHRIKFLGRVPREEVFNLLAEAAAVVFTNLREEGGVPLGEAMLSGAPVIVLAQGGTRTVAASSTDPSRVVLIQPAGVEETARRMGEAMTRLSRNPPTSSGPTLDQEKARRILREVFEGAMASRPPRPELKHV